MQLLRIALLAQLEPQLVNVKFSSMPLVTLFKFLPRPRVLGPASWIRTRIPDVVPAWQLPQPVKEMADAESHVCMTRSCTQPCSVAVAAPPFSQHTGTRLASYREGSRRYPRSSARVCDIRPMKIQADIPAMSFFAIIVVLQFFLDERDQRTLSRGALVNEAAFHCQRDPPKSLGLDACMSAGSLPPHWLLLERRPFGLHQHQRQTGRNRTREDVDVP